MNSEIVRCEIKEVDLINGTGARWISYEVLSQATNSFRHDAVFEEGYGGVVYRARLQGLNRIVAIKKLKSHFPEQSKKDFIAEINNTGNLRHRNVVQLIGWCCQYSGIGRGELFLVYDQFAMNHTLHKFLFDKKPLLSWENRYKIACGLASGVDYLHTGWDKSVIHRDIKSGNVMLGHDFTPKLGNFWLAKSSDHGKTINTTLAWGSYYYMAPEVYFTGAKASKESDVYSFGIVALEIATGKGPSAQQPRSAMPLLSWVWDLHTRDRILDAVDRDLLDTQLDESQARRLLAVGLWCCNARAFERPQMDQVIAVLKGYMPLSDVPLKPLDDYFGAAIECYGQAHHIVADEIGREIHEAPALINGIGGARSISYEELYHPTNSNSKEYKVLGEGKYGVVYLACLRNHPGRHVAVKKLKSEFVEQSKKDFLAEIANTSKLRHPNLVQLIGWCEEPEKLLLIFEFVPNLTLHTHLFGKNLSQPLSWANRYKIACELATGVDYLHTGWVDKCVIHRDIKPENVMLDNDWTPKLGDFGLARLSDHGKSMHNTASRGSHGYMAPELSYAGAKASKESDIFSFGIIALNIATGRQPYIEQEKIPLLSWVWNLHTKNDILKAVDPILQLRADQSFNESDQAVRLLLVGLWCCNVVPSERPQMIKVIKVLKGDTHLLDPAKIVKPLKGYYACFMDP